MKREALAALLVTVALIAASLLGMTVFLGAHPLWSVRTGVIGSTGGLVVYAVLRLARLRPTPLAIFGALALAALGLVVVQGKAFFVASFSENALAGRFWFLGWFGVMAASCLTPSALAAVVLRR
jgi:hypothetical protein